MILPNINFDRLKIFYLATKYQRFNKAAEEMDLDPSAATRYIQKLESELNCKLFSRHGAGKFTLTQQGEALQKIAHDIFGRIAEIQPTLASVANRIEGPLKVAIHSGLTTKFFNGCIGEFLKEYPKMELDIITNDTPIDVNVREADVVICPWTPSNRDIVERPLFSYHSYLYASQRYVERYGEPKAIEDLKHHYFIASSFRNVISLDAVNWYLYLGTDAPHKVSHRSNSNETIAQFMEEGLGIGAADSFQKNKLYPHWIPILPELKSPKRDIYFIYGNTFKDSKKVSALYAFLQTKAKKLFTKK